MPGADEDGATALECSHRVVNKLWRIAENGFSYRGPSNNCVKTGFGIEPMPATFWGPLILLPAMETGYLIYQLFNALEGLMWMGIAVAVPFVLKPKTRQGISAIAAASLGFVLFGISDFLEAPTNGQLPAWLWLFKILCAGFLLATRFWYIGWDRFSFRDRYVVFGVCCLIATAGVIYLQNRLYGL
jgi:hypothetical protein